MNRICSGLALLLLMAMTGPVVAQTALTTGNVIVLQSSNGGTALSNTATGINLLELSPTTPAQTTPVQTINASSALNLFTSGTATSVQLLRANPNGSLTFTGHVGMGTGNINTNTARQAGVLNLDGTLTAGPTYTGASGNQTRSAVTNNGTDFYIGDQGGLFLNGGTTPALAGNFRGTSIVNGQTYVLQASGTATNIVVNTTNPALPPTSGTPTITGLTGLTNLSTAQDFSILSSTVGGSVDTLYISTSTGISKFSFDGSAWTARGSAAISGGVYGIAAVPGTTGIDLYLTGGNGATVANTLSKINDSAAFNADISLGAATVLYTTPANTTLRGVALVATPVPEPSTVLLAAAGGLGLLRLVRRRNKS